MCGIAGVVGGGDTRAALEARVRDMSLAVAHRGPDGDGIWSDPSAPACLAQRRLAIVDLSEAGRQPMVSHSGRWVVVFNGEIYNHREIRSELEAHGVSYAGHSDTRALVEAIDLWGFEPALHRSNGMFAVAAWDTRDRRLLVARDRLGEKPLYWHRAPNGSLLFASELRGVLAGCDEVPPINERAMASLLAWSYIPHPHTARTGVFQLAPGSMLEVALRNGHVEVTERVWWSLSDAIAASVGRRSPMSLEGATDELQDLLTDSVRLRMDADVPLGAFLSGGIDSSVVAAIAQQLLGGRLRTFTVRMPDGAFDESEPALAVARHLSTDHTVVDLSKGDVIAEVLRMSEVYDEPLADPSMLPTTLLCATASQNLTVCLGGDGGDELFAGYNRHIYGEAISRRTARLPTGLRQVMSGALLSASPASVDRWAGALSKVLPRRLQVPNVGDKLQKLGALVRDPHDAWPLLAQVWPSDVLRVAPYVPDVAPVAGVSNGVERMVFADTACVLPDQMLVKVDRASMAAPLEVRVPMLDHRLLEWAWALPLGLKVSGGTGKLVMRNLARRLIPTEIVDRPKLGFDPPIGQWLRGELRDWAEERLERVALHGALIDETAVRATWSEHLNGKRNWDYRLWALLMLPEPTA